MVENEGPCNKCLDNPPDAYCKKYPYMLDCPDYKKWYDEVLTTLSEKAQKLRAGGIKYLKEIGVIRFAFTCDLCLDRDNCEFSYDAYNTDGDCLKEK